MRPNYAEKHWNIFERKNFDLTSVSRKTKKAVLTVRTREMKYWDAFEALPDCRWCVGGTCREHPNDTGYACPDCYGSGKTGWEPK